MLSTPVLSEEQVEKFLRDGCLVVPGGFGPGDMETIERWCREIADAPEAPGRQWVYHEKSQLDTQRDLISRIEYMSPFHAGFDELGRVLAAPIGQVLGSEAILFKEKINFKMPGGDGFKPHQDSQAGWGKYADFFVTVVVCVDEATLENGCLQIVAGEERKDIYREWEPLTETDLNGMDFIPTPTVPGDLVLLDCFAPHYSEPNLSKDVRRLYFATYNRRSAGDHMAEYYADKRASYPPDIEREPGKSYVFRV